MHAPHLLATAAAKGLFWEGVSESEFVSVCACVCVWRWFLLSGVRLLGNSPFLETR